MNGFALHPQLDADTHRVGDLDFTRVLLMDDARFPWLILVPRVPDCANSPICRSTISIACSTRSTSPRARCTRL